MSRKVTWYLEQGFNIAGTGGKKLSGFFDKSILKHKFMEPAGNYTLVAIDGKKETRIFLKITASGEVIPPIEPKEKSKKEHSITEPFKFVIHNPIDSSKPLMGVIYNIDESILKKEPGAKPLTKPKAKGIENTLKKALSRKDRLKQILTLNPELNTIQIKHHHEEIHPATESPQNPNFGARDFIILEFPYSHERQSQFEYFSEALSTYIKYLNSTAEMEGIPIPEQSFTKARLNYLVVSSNPEHHRSVRINEGETVKIRVDYTDPNKEINSFEWTISDESGSRQITTGITNPEIEYTLTGKKGAKITCRAYNLKPDGTKIKLMRKGFFSDEELSASIKIKVEDRTESKEKIKWKKHRGKKFGVEPKGDPEVDKGTKEALDDPEVQALLDELSEGDDGVVIDPRIIKK